jgi:transposase
MVRSLLEERDDQKRRFEEQRRRVEEQQQRSDDLHVENLRLQLELERFKKWYYGPRADRLQSSGDLAQLLLNFERIHHVRKKYACPGCESSGEHPQIETAAKPESAIDKGLAGPGLLAYIVTSKFSDYLPLYRLEDIFERQGFEISRATQSVWCGDVADLVEPLYELMAERVRTSHVVATDDAIMPMLSKGKVVNARMWVYVGDDAHPYNVFDFTLNRGRDGPKYFLKDYRQVLLADAYGGYNGVVAGNERSCVLRATSTRRV